MEEKRILICNKCNVELKPTQVDFEYLGNSFHAEMPRCPECGQVFIPEELVKGRISEVEMMLEDK